MTSNKNKFKKEKSTKSQDNIRRKNIVQQQGKHQKEYDLTPLLEGKIQYAKILHRYNIEQVQKECGAFNLTYLPTAN